MTLAQLLHEINIDNNTGIYVEGNFRCTIGALLRVDNLYNAYALMEVDMITIDDYIPDELKITLKG